MRDDRLDARRFPQAATHLDPQRGSDGSHDRLDGHRLNRPSGSCPVEVDDVDPGRSGGRHRFGGCDWIVAVDRLSSEISLGQSDDPAAPQVDRRKELERPLRVVSRLTGLGPTGGLDVCHASIVAF